MSRRTRQSLPGQPVPVKPVERSRTFVSLRLQVSLALVLMVVAVAGVLGLLIGESSEMQLRARIGVSLQTDAARIAEQVNKEMAARTRELKLIATLDPMASLHDTTQVQALLDGLRASVPAYLWLGMTDTQGRLLVASGGDAAAAARVSAGQEPQPMVLSHPVRAADGTVDGVIVAQLGWGWVRDIANGVLAQEGESNGAREFTLVSPRDTILLGKPGSVNTPLSLPSNARARAGYTTWSVETWPDGHDYLTASAFVAGEGAYPGPGSVQMQWVVLVRQDALTAFAPVADLRLQILLVSLALAALMALVGWLVAGRITAPLRRIARAADKLSQGGHDELPAVNGPQEIRSLADSLRAMVHALTTKQVALEEMQTVAERDPLTGLYNRNGLQSWLRGRMQQGDLQHGGSLMIFLTDLDGFKQVNDRFGHPAGDAVLREVARRMIQSVRQIDAVARLGGDEYVLVLDAPSGPGDPQAEAVAQAVFEAVAGMYDVGGGQQARVGISLGGALWPEDDVRVERVMSKADAALYAAKRAGKNRIMMHLEPTAGQ